MPITEDDIRRIVREELKAALRPALRQELGAATPGPLAPGAERPLGWTRSEHQRRGRRVERICSADGKSIIQTRVHR